MTTAFDEWYKEVAKKKGWDAVMWQQRGTKKRKITRTDSDRVQSAIQEEQLWEETKRVVSDDYSDMRWDRFNCSFPYLKYS